MSADSLLFIRQRAGDDPVVNAASPTHSAGLDGLSMA